MKKPLPKPSFITEGFFLYPDFSCFRIFLCYDRGTKENRGR